MNRRGLLGRLALAMVAGATAFRASEAVAETPEAEVPKVAYGLSDLEKINFALGNIDNHIEGMGGPDKVSITLVVNGPALAGFRLDKATPDLTRKLAALVAHGVVLGACNNTMKAQKLTLGDLQPGFVAVEEGGVTRLAKLQHEGYAYIRP